MGDRHRRRGRRRLSTSPHQEDGSAFLEFEDDISWDAVDVDRQELPVEDIPIPVDEPPARPVPEDAAQEPTSRVDLFSRRVLALFADAALVFVVNVITWAIGGDLVSQIVGLVASAAYFTYFEGRPGGRTLGKRWMGLRIVDLGGREAIGYPRALLRWLGRIVSLIPAGLGCAWMLWGHGRQTWHDRMVGTVVVHVDHPDDA